MMERLMAIIKKAGGMILAADLEHADVEVKSTRGDLRTNYDTAVEEFLRRELALVLPEAQFIGEESGLQKREADKYCFIVDPIDGTANFTWDYHHSAVSIALAKRERILAGLVYNPYLDELFHARAGEGAYLNGRLIQVSQRSLRDGLICFGTSPYDKTKAAATFSLARLLLPKANIPATTALGVLEKDGRRKALLAGANVVMLDFTPESYRMHYDIYPGKTHVATEMDGYLEVLKKELQSIGRTVGRDRPLESGLKNGFQAGPNKA